MTLFVSAKYVKNDLRKLSVLAMKNIVNSELKMVGHNLWI